MGRLRGKRNRDQDRYWAIQLRAEQSGMISAADAAACSHCGNLAPASRMHKDWCLACVSDWVDTADPWLIAQARASLPAECVPVTTMNQIDRIRDYVLEPIQDEEFLPLTQFMGHKGIGSQRSMWNFLRAMYVAELETTGEVAQLGVAYPNTVHLCGRHAPVQRGSLTGFLSRIHSAGVAFHLVRKDARFLEYLRGFVSDNRLERSIFTYRRTAIDVFDRARQMRCDAKYGKAHFDKYSPRHWPFEGERASRLRDTGQMDELPDIVMQIGELVPINMPETLRQDLCQDLVVAVLSGDTTIEALRGSTRHYIKEAFRHHPLRYGRYSLDQPAPWDSFKGEEYNIPRDRITGEEPGARRSVWEKWTNGQALIHDPEPEHGWHKGRDRSLGMASVGDQLRMKHGGFAITGGIDLADEPSIDEEIADVYAQDQHPQWRRKFID